MIPLPFRRPKRSATIDALYGMIVAQARSPSFYRGYGVPDSVETRIDMIMLHLVLVLRGLRGEGAAQPMAERDRSVAEQNRPLAQGLFDHFCQDMDDNFREMGVGDLTVPKEMLRIAEAFYGRAKVYDAALDAGDVAALETAFARNIFNTTEINSGARRLAAYMRDAVRAIGTQDALLRGEVRFPDPETVAPA
jgi:cytochrome b pre-mRNA-processing protein 3